MNRKALASALIGLGLLFMTLGLYQVNQYMISGATASATMSSFTQLGAEAEAYAAQLSASLAQMSGTLAQVIFIDFALGIVLALAGVFAYPDK